MTKQYAHNAILNHTLLDQERFMENVSEMPDTCHIWNGKKQTKGYGWFKLESGYVLAHRLAYFIGNGCLEKTLLVCHKCDIPACVNPKHLFQTTIAGNNADKVAKGRQPKIGKARASVLGSMTSAAKAKSSRKNGKLGGRPKKVSHGH